MVYSTIPGYLSWRNTTNGSWFIIELVAVLSQYSPRGEDLLSMLTIVNNNVTYCYTSYNTDEPDYHLKKEVVDTVSRLTRRVYFFRAWVKSKYPRLDDLEFLIWL